jgi:hypothetical protein
MMVITKRGIAMTSKCWINCLGAALTRRCQLGTDVLRRHAVDTLFQGRYRAHALMERSLV